MQVHKTFEISNVEQGMMNYKVNEECACYFNIHDSLPSGLYDLAKVQYLTTSKSKNRKEYMA